MSADEAAGVRAAFPEAGACRRPPAWARSLGAPDAAAARQRGAEARFLPPLVRGEEMWCQFFSEPGSGSDLASAQTRAVRDGDVWHVDGQKVWTSGAQYADRGMLLARTNRDVPKHQGLSFFIIDVDQPGIDVRPLHQMNGAHGFNEVFFTDAQVDADRLISEENGGWSVAVTVLMYERFMSSLPSVAAGRQARQAGPAGRRGCPARRCSSGLGPDQRQRGGHRRGPASWARRATRCCGSGWPRCGTKETLTATWSAAGQSVGGPGGAQRARAR